MIVYAHTNKRRLIHVIYCDYSIRYHYAFCYCNLQNKNVQIPTSNKLNFQSSTTNRYLTIDARRKEKDLDWHALLGVSSLSCVALAALHRQQWWRRLTASHDFTRYAYRDGV